MTQAANPNAEPVIKFAEGSTDLRICFKSSRAISTIEKKDGKYRVVSLYEGKIDECDTYALARDKALNAAMTQEPRVTVKREVA